jgi:Na+-translocating ferredoxin:NAD+ oxidoreductase subunit G
MSAAWESSATGMAARTAVILFLFIIVFTGLLSTAQYLTRPAIEASATEEKMKLLDEVLPRKRIRQPAARGHADPAADSRPWPAR